ARINRAARHLCHTVLSRHGVVYDMEFTGFHANPLRRNCEIGQKRISNPKSEISNWTRTGVELSVQTAPRSWESNLQFRISDLRYAFVQFQKFLLLFPYPAPGQPDRLENWLISRTTAEIPIHVMDDLGVRGFRIFIQ